MSPGVAELVAALRAVKEEYGLDSISGTMRLPDGHALTLRCSGSLLSLEREDGEMALVEVGG